MFALSSGYMKKNIVVFICFSILACMNTVSAQGLSATDKRFNDYKERFVTELWAVYPSWAASVGFHKYDNVLVIPDSKSRTKERIPHHS